MNINELHNLFFELFTQAYGYNPTTITRKWSDWTEEDYLEEITYLETYVFQGK